MIYTNSLSNQKRIRLSLSGVVKFLLTTLLLSSCSSQPPLKPVVIQAESKPVKMEITSSQTQQIDDQIYLDGIDALEQDNLIQAQQYFRKFIKKYPELAGAYTNLALITFKQQKYESSLKLVNKAINLNPSQEHAYQLRAQLNINNGQINAAKNDYLEAIQINPEYANAQYNLALLYDIYLQEINLAIKHYEIYISLINKPDETTQEWINHLKSTLNNG